MSDDPVTRALASALSIGEDAAATTRTVIEKVIGSRTLDALDGLGADWIGRVRTRKTLEFAREIAESAERRGGAAHPLPEGTGLRILEGGALADEPDVRAMWRNLAINATDDPAKAHPFVLETLKKMSAEDARVLRRVAATKPDGTVDLPRIGEYREPGLWPALARLHAYGLTAEPGMSYGLDPPAPADTSLHSRLNEVGRQFLAAVADPVAEGS